MDILRTDRTYKTRANAVKQVRDTAAKIGVEFGTVHYVIAVNEDGRFAPVVTHCVDKRIADHPMVWAHNGVTVTG